MSFVSVALVAVGLAALCIACLTLRPDQLLGLAVWVILCCDARVPVAHLSIGGRALAVCLILAAHVKFSIRDGGRTRHDVDAPIAVLSAMLVAIGVRHGELGIVGQAIVGAISLLLCVPRMDSLIAGLGLRRRIFGHLCGYMILSLAVGLASPSIGVEGIRLCGLTANANQMGFYAFVTIATAVLIADLGRVRWVGAIAAAACLLWSGSRASALAAALVAVAALALFRGVRRRTAIVVCFATLVGLYLARSIVFASTGLLRQTASRDDSWAEASRALSWDRWWGVGFKELHTEVASSPLRAAAAGGLVGLALLLLSCVLLLKGALGRGKTAAVMVVVALIHSLFEGWLVSVTGAVLFTFFLAIVLTTPAATNQLPSNGGVEWRLKLRHEPQDRSAPTH